MKTPHYAASVPVDDGGPKAGTISGRLIPILSPRPEHIFIEDIAGHISKICRYSGGCLSFFSVAQHSVLAADIAEKYYEDKELAREALLHDAAEYLIGDFIRPYKLLIPDYDKYEDILHKAIAVKYSIPVEMTDSCKYIDNLMVAWEKRDIIHPDAVWPGLPNIHNYKFEPIQPWTWENARDIFLFKFRQLFGDMD